MSLLTNQIHMSIKDILSHKLSMFNYRLPNDRTMYESSLIYCNLCDFSCDLTDKSSIICHYLSKHPDDNIVYSYLWPQMELVQSEYKIKYYLIKANLKVRSIEQSSTLNSSIQYPTTLLNQSETESKDQNDEDNNNESNLELSVKFMLDKVIDWIEQNPIPSATATTLTQDDVQELEEEQEVQEVEMPGEEPFEIQAPNDSLNELIRLTSTALYQKNQQKYLTNVPINLQLDNSFLVHLLAINKIENVFRVKQIHDYLGGCFICGKQVEFNMKHYQTHFSNEMTVYMCLHCNYKEYRQLDNQSSNQNITSSVDQTNLLTNEPYQIDSNDITIEEKLLENHMSECHSIDFQQIFQQHQQLNSNQNSGIVVIESTPMNDMYLSINIKSIKYIDDELLRKDQFRTDMLYSCPICTGDINMYTQNQTTNTSNSHPYNQFENVTFDYLLNHFLLQHQFKAIPLFVCSECNCVRVSLIDCVYHYIRYHFNKKIQIGLCAFNVYDRVQSQIAQLQGADNLNQSGHGKSHAKSKSSTTNATTSSTTNSSPSSSMPCLQYLPLAATTTNTIYGAGPLIYCAICNENYSNEQAFIRHSYLCHLLDPNINLNWFKVYVPIGQNTMGMSQNFESSLQQIAAAMAMADLNPTDGSISLVDANGQPINTDTNLTLMYECPLCFKSVSSKDSINRHLLYHALNENFEYDITCTTCSKQLSPSQNLAECLLHSREFKTHRLSVNYSKYVLTNVDSGQTLPMVSCVLCTNESKNLISSMSHILMDHFMYDSGVVKFKRFVNSLLKTAGLILTPSKPKIKNQLKADLLLSQINAELIDYFNTQFPSLIDELVISVLTAAQTNDGSKISTNRPEAFFNEIKCFKCSKFSTKLKSSLFHHLNTAHGFELTHMEKLFDLHIQKQLKLIDRDNLIEKFDKSLRLIAEQQLNLLKENKEKSAAQYESIKEQQKILIQQQVSTTPLTTIQSEHHQHQQQQQQQHSVEQLQHISSESSRMPSGVEQLVLSADQSQEIIVQVAQQSTITSSSTTPSSTQISQPSTTTTATSASNNQSLGVISNSASNLTQTSSHTVSKSNKKEISAASSDKIDSTIDQVLSQICKDDYEKNDSSSSSSSMLVDHGQITVHAQPPEAENLFVFKCNLCEPYTTDDATQLLEHYKVNHQVELTIADSSTLLAAAVAAFQTGHTIEMTGAILNTISSVTDENGLTIISGEEVPVHTTVQYKCTICQMIFYEKQFIVQHLYDAHNFEIDVSYFEEIELQQQEQLQQKIYEQQQEQLMLQQQQQQQQQHQQQSNQTIDQIVQHQSNVVQSTTEGHTADLQAANLIPTVQSAQVTTSSSANNGNNMNADETAAVMMMMMNGSLTNQNQPILLQTESGIQTAQIVINSSQLAGLDTSGVTLPGGATILTTAIPAIPIDSTPIVQPQTIKPTIAYNCSYCSFGADKLKKISDHLKSNHPLKEKTCMDNIRNQIIRLPNEDLPTYHNQNPTTVASLLQQKHLQSQSNQLSSGILNLANNINSSVSSNLTSHATNADSSTKQLTSSTQQQQQQQLQQQQQQQPVVQQTTGRKRGPKPKTNQSSATQRPQTVANTLSRQQQQQQQQYQQQMAQQHPGIKTPTILTMDANSQIIIDFNQNDDLLCSYCDYTMNNLNYMRTHIKYKHRNMPITFQNKLTYRFYTIVEWPLTPVPTLTPASASPTSANTHNTSTTTSQSSTSTTTTTTTTTNHQSNYSSTHQSTNSTQPLTNHADRNSPSQLTNSSILQSSNTTSGTLTTSSEIELSKIQSNEQMLQDSSVHSVQAHASGLSTSSNAIMQNKSASSEHLQQLATHFTTTTSATTMNTLAQTSNSNIVAAGSATSMTHKARTPREFKDFKETKSASLVGSTPGAININNVNSILKKLGVNKNITPTGITVSAAGQSVSSSSSSPLTTLISSISAGKTVNNSVVNVNLNVLKDVNIDEMIDDDDDEERKFLIRELEKKANTKRAPVGSKDQNGDLSDSGSVCGTGIKRSRTNSTTNQNSTSVLSNSTNQSQNLLSQLNITLNCHYCWAQFQLNVTKNLKNSVQQKENGKYMQHLTLHLNAPYKCNECSYPITDTKTFFKHKQFYKHDEKTCIMVDNDISTTTQNSYSCATTATTTTAASASTTASALVASGQTRRKILIATRLRQHNAQQMQLKEEEKLLNELNESNEMQLYHDKDSFKCSLCYPDNDSIPMTAISCLNKTPTGSNLGASNLSFDKEQVLKHVLIVHLSFLAYKCDTCSQFYAFDEPQTKQHAGLVHHCGSGEGNTCHFKLIKTEEEINLAINRAQQFITKISASKKPENVKTKFIQSSQLQSNSNAPIEAQPKYKCCKCNLSENSGSESNTNPSEQNPVVLYSYQDALDHVMNVHMASQPPGIKKDKKLNYELELFEQNLEDLLASETGVITTVQASQLTPTDSNNNNNNNNNSDELNDQDLDDQEDDLGEISDDFYYSDENSDLTEWNVILTEPNQPQANLNSSLSPFNRRKRFKTNNNQSICFPGDSQALDTISSCKKMKKFYFKPYLLYKCLLCSRKMSQFEPEHWLKHDLEKDAILFSQAQNRSSDSVSKFIYSQINCVKPLANASTSTSAGVATEATNAAAINNPTTTTTTNSTNGTNQISKTYKSFSEFFQNYKTDSQLKLDENSSDLVAFKMINCLICGLELRYSYADILKHFQSEHEFNLFDLGIKLNDLEIMQSLVLNNSLQLSLGVHLKRRCFIKIPPNLVNPSMGEVKVTRCELIDREIKMLNEIYKEQIVEKQIVSWLNSEQFMRRNFNYNSFVCIICNSTKSSILESHYNLKKGLLIHHQNTNVQTSVNQTDSNRMQFFSEEMKTVVLTNHILSHFNEYCYRCMSCKISWPDRTQLLKHAQECSNSQVVRTKTKYKLKANCRLQLKFYLQTYLDYWQQEKANEIKNYDELVPKREGNTQKFRVFLKDVFLNKKMFLDVCSHYNLKQVNLDEKIILFAHEDQQDKQETSQEHTIEKNENVTHETKQNSDVQMEVDTK